MDRVYQANAIETPPSTTASSGSYPTAGNKAFGQLATVPGPYWFYSITEEIRNALIAAGVTPDAAKVNQLAEAMSKFLPLSGGTMTGSISFSNGPKIEQFNGDYKGIDIRASQETTDGAFLGLYAKDAPQGRGTFSLCAVDESARCDLTGFPNGTLTWGGKNVVCGTRAMYGTVDTLVLHNGVKIQWGSIPAYTTTVTFPIPYDGGCQVFLSPLLESTSLSTHTMLGYLSGLFGTNKVTTTGFTRVGDSNSIAMPVRWFAIGV